MPGHYRVSDGIMRDNHEIMLTFQEGERPPISFSEDAPANTAANTEAVVGQEPGTGATGDGESAGSSSGFWIMLGMLFVFMYLFVIRPEGKRKKKREEFQTSIEKGDQVVTAGGLHGTVAAMDDHTITLKVSDTVRLKFDRIAVSRTASAPVEEGAAAKS
jgi:preprotein translocase subunit YajC